jgi:hypothetical protein
MAVRLQAIEFKTSKIEEIEALVRKTRDERGPVIRGTITACRNQPGTYLTLVELPAGDAQPGSEASPETGRLVADMSRLCDEPPKLYSLGLPSLPKPRQAADD